VTGKIQVRKPGKAAALLQWPSIRAILAGCLMLMVSSSFLLTVSVMANEVQTITDIRNWHHPVKSVFQKHQVEVSKVELHNQTYPVFYVKFPYDPWLGHNDKYFKPLYYETLKANGFWDYALVDRSAGVRINLRWDKKTKTLSEALESTK
jgi:hypothetical protein